MAGYSDLFNGYGKRILDQNTEVESSKRPNVPSLSAVGNSSESYCEECDIHFARPYTLHRHLEDIHGSFAKLTCDENGCGKAFTRKDTLARHKLMQHGTGKIPCPECRGLVRKSALAEHMRTAKCHRERISAYAGTAHGSGEGDLLVNQPISDKMEVQDNPEVDDSEKMEVDIVGTHQPSPNNYHHAAGNIGPPQAPELDSSLSQTPTSSGASSLLTPPSSLFDEYLNQVGPVYSLDSALHQMINSLADSGPEIIPDSPRPSLREVSIGPLWYEDFQEEPDPADKVEHKRDELPAAKSFSNPRNWMKIRSFLQSQNPPPGFYKMSIGSRCVLCGANLGRSPEAVYRHAKMHAEVLEYPFECPVCKIKFRFKRDLKLHSSTADIWAFCPGKSSDEHLDDDDWVAQASNEDREAFIMLVRRWESLQLRWYLSIIDTLLEEYGDQHAGTKAHTERAPSAAASIVSAKAFTQAGYDHRQFGCDMDTLLEKFRTASISASEYSGLKFNDCQIQQLSAQAQKMIDRALTPRGVDVEEALSHVQLRCPNQVFLLVVQLLLRDYAARGCERVVRKMMKYDINVNAADDMGETALIKAIQGRHERVARLLVNHGANLVKQTPEGMTMLSLACKFRLPHTVQLLITKNADIDRADTDGMTPLMYAVGGPSNWKIVEILLKHGANANCRRQKGRTALMEMIMVGFGYNYESDWTVLKLLLRNGADKSLCDNQGLDAYSYAELLHPEEAELLALLDYSGRRESQTERMKGRNLTKLRDPAKAVNPILR